MDDLDRSLGLRRRTVRLDEHRRGWLAEGQRVVGDIAGALEISQERVAHVGSTAVASLPAKPILDIAVLAAAGPETDRLASAIEELGYIDRGQGAGSIGRLLVFEPTPDVRSIHVHILDDAQPWWDEYHAFRDALRADPDLRATYARLKTRLAAEHPLNRSAYVEGKADFIQATLKRRSVMWQLEGVHPQRDEER